MQAAQAQSSAAPVRQIILSGAQLAAGGFLLPAAALVYLELRGRLAFVGAPPGATETKALIGAVLYELQSEASSGS